MPPDELAAELMGAFGPEGYGPGIIEVLHVSYWLMRAHRQPYRQSARLRNSVTRALHVLEDAGLIENTVRLVPVGARLANLRPTPAGEAAIRDGTVSAALAQATRASASYNPFGAETAR